MSLTKFMGELLCQSPFFKVTLKIKPHFPPGGRARLSPSQMSLCVTEQRTCVCTQRTPAC